MGLNMARFRDRPGRILGVTFSALLSFISAFAAMGLVARAQNSDQDQPGLIKPAVPIAAYLSASQRIAPMPLAERIRLHAVPQRGVCSIAPAKRDEDGLISGDGKMFVEVYGDPFAEQVVFHQERLLQPWKGNALEAPKIAGVLPEVRKLMLRGEYRKALDLSLSTADQTDTKPGTGNLRDHPAFKMRIDVPGQHSVTNYLRTLDFESGEVRVSWADRDGLWERRTFVSRPADVVVQLLTTPENSKLNAKISLDTSDVPRYLGFADPARDMTPHPYRPHVPLGPNEQPAISGDWQGRQKTQDGVIHLPGADQIGFQRRFDGHDLVLQAHYSVESGNPGYASVTRIIANGGSLKSGQDSVVVEGSQSLLLITRIQAYADLRQSDVDALESAVDQVNPDYEQLLADHRTVQTEVMDRVSVDFGGVPQHSLSAEEMLVDQRTRTGFNPALLENLFDMGRYWLYLRSGEFPPMWGHVNINVNLQISGADLGDLPEALKPFVRWVESLLPDSRRNAQNIFGAQGALFAIHPTQSGGPLTHFDYSWPHQYWISAGGWLYSPFWDYYLITGDRQFLREHVLPGLKELALFYESYLTEKDENGNYIFVPSYSPENSPSNTEEAPAVINADMDIMVCREVLTHLIVASQILGVEADSIPKWRAMLEKLPPYLLDDDGALKEWAWPTLDENQDHRHVSHLYGVWPGDEITVDATPELAKAAWIAVRKRGQENAVAHGLLHRALVAARLKDSYLVNFDLKQILELGYVNPSLTTMHNPYFLSSPDPQGALPTLMMEMLVYSRPGEIELLPAVPASLTQGSIKGVLCRTQAKIDDLTWNLNTRTIDVTISSRVKQDVRLVVRQGMESVTAPGGVLTSSPKSGAEMVNLRLPESKPVTLHVKVGTRNPADWVEHFR